MLDLVPLAGSRREMMDLDGYAQLIGQALQFELPQSHARTVRSAAVGGDDQPTRERVANLADLSPPTADRLNRESRGVVVDADGDPTRVGRQIIDSIGHSAAEFLDQEVVHAHFFRIASRTPFAAGVLEISDQLLLLRIDRNSRLVLGHRRLYGLVDEAKLRVAVGVVGAFAGLAFGLQAELLFLQQLADDRVADLVPEIAEFIRESAQALAGPAQRRHRIAARVGFDQCVQIVEQTRVRFGQRFASPTRPTDPIGRRPRRRIEFLEPPSDRARRDPRDARNRGYPAMASRPSLRCGEKTSLPFIQSRRYRCMARFELSQGIFVDHPLRYNAPPKTGIQAAHSLQSDSSI